ncbi:MAG: hypothetical protein ACP5OZ_03040 [Candidatus Woesearchaeota archaeon]
MSNGEGSGGTEESLKNLGGAMIGVIVVITIVSIISLLIYPYLSNNKARFMVSQSFNRLFNTINNNLLKDGNNATEFFALIDNFIVVGFGKNGFKDYAVRGKLSTFESGNKLIDKPKICGDNACICVCKKKDDCRSFQDCKILSDSIENIRVVEKLKYNFGAQIDNNDISKGYYLFMLNNPLAYFSKDDDSKIVLSLKRVGNDVVISEYKP